jgi:hypothetical protein
MRPLAFALAIGSHILGFGYPLDVSFNSRVLRRPISASNTLELHPSELFSSRMIRSESLPPFPLLRFSSKPFSLLSALQRLHPIRKAVPLFATRRISSGRGRLLSWVFSSFGRFPPPSLPQNHFPSADPSTILGPKSLSTHRTRILEVSLWTAWLFSLRKGRRPV